MCMSVFKNMYSWIPWQLANVNFQEFQLEKYKYFYKFFIDILCFSLSAKLSCSDILLIIIVVKFYSKD